MEEIKAAKKHFSKLGRMFVAGTLIIYAVQLMPMAVIGYLKPEWMADPNISLLVSILPMYLIGMPLLVLLVKQVPAERVEKHDMRAGQFAVSAVICFGLVYFCNIIGNIFTVIIGLLKGGAVQNVIADVASSVNILFVFVYMVLLAPLVEEYVFRKLIVDRTVRYGQGIAVLVSGLMFGLFHGNLNQFVYAFTLGAFLAFLYVKTGKLKITVGLHMMINFMGGIVSSLLLRLIDLEAYQEAAASGDMTKMMSEVMEHLTGWAAYGVYVLFIFGMIIAGLVLLIVFLAKRRFTFAQGEVVLPKGKRFGAVILNAGMLAYCVIWTAMIVWQLFV